MNLRKLFPVTLLLALMLVLIPAKKAYADAPLEKYFKDYNLDYSPSVTVLVDQPVRDSNTVFDGGFYLDGFSDVVGHTFIRVYDGKEVNYYGFYPQNSENLLSSAFLGTKGELHKNNTVVRKSEITGLPMSATLKEEDSESNHSWDYAKIYRIGPYQASQINYYANNYIMSSLWTGRYWIQHNNCTTFAFMALNYIDVMPKFYAHFWTVECTGSLDVPVTLYGYAPGPAGEDIKKASGSYLIETPPFPGSGDKPKVEQKDNWNYY